MPIYFENKNHNEIARFGYIKFKYIRENIAKLYSKQLYETYSQIAYHFSPSERRKLYSESINTAYFYKVPENVINFLFQSDCYGSISISTSKELFKKLENTHDEYLC